MTPAAGARLLYGSLLLTGAGRLFRGGSSRRFRAVVRVLGARHVLQAVALTWWPTHAARQAGGVLDVLHAATDLGCVVADPGRRRAAVIDASVAVAFVCTVAVR